MKRRRVHTLRRTKRGAAALDAANTRALNEEDPEHIETGPRMSESRSNGDRFDEAREWLDPYGLDDERAEEEW